MVGKNNQDKDDQSDVNKSGKSKTVRIAQH
jgi:hypothetical protein